MPEKSIYEEDKALTAYLEEAGRSKPLSAEEERELSERIKKGDLEARDKLVMANLKFAASVAMQFQGQGLDLLDLINEGNIGLIEAANRFDGSKGFKFISYAVWWVRQVIIQALAEQARTIRLPFKRIGLMEKIRRISEEFRQEQEREPALADIAGELGVSLEQIQGTLEIGRATWSLDRQFDNDDEARNLFDVIADTRTPAPDAALADESVKRAIAEALGTLDEREAEVIWLNFGFGEEGPLTLDEIGARMGLTRERARQIKEIALRRLRHPKRAAKLAAVLDGFEPNEIPRGIGAPHSAPAQNMALSALLDVSNPEVRIILKRTRHILLEAGVIMRIARNGGMTSVRLLVKQIYQRNHDVALALRQFGILNCKLALAIEKEYRKLLRIAAVNDGDGQKPFPADGMARKQARAQFLGALDELIKTKSARAEFLSVRQERARVWEEHKQQETQERSNGVMETEAVETGVITQSSNPILQRLLRFKTMQELGIKSGEEIKALVAEHGGNPGKALLARNQGQVSGHVITTVTQYLRSEGVQIVEPPRGGAKRSAQTRPDNAKPTKGALSFPEETKPPAPPPAAPVEKSPFSNPIAEELGALASLTPLLESFGRWAGENQDWLPKAKRALTLLGWGHDITGYGMSIVASSHIIQAASYLGLIHKEEGDNS